MRSESYLCDNGRVDPLPSRRTGGPISPVGLAGHERQSAFRLQIDVRFFALYRERAGRNTVAIQLPERATVADLTGEVRRQFPMLAPPEVQIVVAVNAEYAEPETVLSNGDDVCLIPPVSGG